MVKKQTTHEFFDIRFSWNDPVGSVRAAQVLPEDLTLKFLCHYLSISKSTIHRLRTTKGFPSPSGPNSRLVYYPRDEVLLWLLKECGVIGQLENSYKDKENNIYISLYSDGKVRSTSSQFVSLRSKMDEKEPIEEKEFLKILLRHGFNMHFFEEHLDELLPMFIDRQMDATAIENICLELKSRPDLNTSGQDSLLLTYFRNYKGSKKGGRKGRKKADALSVEFASIDYGSMIEELNDYE